MNPTTFIDTLVERVLEQDADNVLSIALGPIRICNGGTQVTISRRRQGVVWTVSVDGVETSTTSVTPLDDNELTFAVRRVARSLRI